MNLKSVPFALIVLALGALPSSVMAQAAAPADSAAPPVAAADEVAQQEAPAATDPEEDEPVATTSAPAPADPAQADPTPAAPPAAAPVEDEANAAEAQAAAEPLAWRNSFFTWTQGVTLATFDRGALPHYNPTYYHYFFLNPRWYLDPQTFLVLGAGAYVEATQDDSSSVSAHEFSLGDMSVELRRTIAWEGFIFLPSVRLTVPLSKLSQAAQRIINTGVGITVVRPIPEAAGMTIAGVARYNRWWATSNTPQSADGQCFGDCSRTSELDRITAGININITPVEHLTLTVGAFWFWINGYNLAPGESGAVTSGGNGVIGDSSPNHWRNFTSYSISVAYDPVEWLNVSIGWANSTFVSPLMNGDGTRVRNPFDISESPDQQITLNLQMTIDAFYSAITHPTGEHDDGLTPEERQRRRQGLGSRDTDENESDAQSRSARF